MAIAIVTALDSVYSAFSLTVPPGNKLSPAVTSMNPVSKWVLRKNVKEKWCVVLLKTNDAPYRSSFPLLKSFIWILHINDLNRLLAVLPASAACLWSHLEQLYNYSYYTGILFTYNRPEVSRYSTDEKYSFSTAFVHFHITLPNVQAAAAVVSSVPDDSWLTLQSTLQQPCQVSVKAGCAGSRGRIFGFFVLLFNMYLASGNAQGVASEHKKFTYANFHIA
ncbi:hypothetical protein T4A_5011 [Trichinella pseudospiralis]|uniref:Uncharacterized protein n=1 Tax=Trichinella pseudospiralis TaxID=6337 RepID=A0A0V1EFP0_TRIPS|nr:hypothetical protein T4A_5011 [Trichinella pseudospiralis]